MASPSRPEANESVPPPGEHERLEALHRLRILDTPAEERFDRITRQLAERLGVPIAYLALIDADRQWLKSRSGEIPTEVERQQAFCSHTILGREPLIVEDAADDPRFRDSRLVRDDPSLRFYAGIPIEAPDGEVVGTVCVADWERRQMSARELAILQGFARRVREEIHSRPTVFVAYGVENVDFALQLVVQCPRLTRTGILDLWSSQWLSSPESPRWHRMSEALERARLALLLLTPEFLHSEFVQQREFRELLQRRQEEGLRIVPLLVESCRWKEIAELAASTPWPTGDRPLQEGDLSALEEHLTSLGGFELPAEDSRPPPTPLVRADSRTDATAPAPAPPPCKLFLSHAGTDTSVAQDLAEQLRGAGMEVWLDVDELKPGDRWMERIEEGLREATAFAIYIAHSGTANWVNLEMRAALDRSAKDPGFRVIPILGPGSDPERLPLFLSQYQWIDVREGELHADVARKILDAVSLSPAESVPVLTPDEIPFRGLEAFDVEHAHLFFGRDREAQELLERLRTAPFMAVIGDSGSGKSSLVRAGLIPLLHGGRYHDGKSWASRWRIAILRPGTDPFRELADALLDLRLEMAPAERLEVREASAGLLEEGTRGLCDCVGALVPRGERTLLVVDQFEELFTQAGEAERMRFIDMLLKSCQCTGERPLHVVATLRADFYSHCFQHPDLPAAVAANQYPLRAMAPEDLMAVIEKPIAWAGFSIAPGLTEAILHDLGSGAGNLALLEHTLLELWERRSGGSLTFEAYKSIGGVHGALEHHADEVFERLDADGRTRARRVLLNLVTTSNTGDATRRRASLEEAGVCGEAAEVTREVLQTLVGERLLTVSRVSENGDQREEVEIVHEALIRGWKRFQTWLEEDREFLLWRRRTKAAFEAWEDSGKDREALLRGVPLAQAECWLGERGEDLTPAGREFIESSILQQRRNRFRKRLYWGFVVVMALSILIGSVYFLVVLAIWQGRANQALETIESLTDTARAAKAEEPAMAELKKEVLLAAQGLFQDTGEVRRAAVARHRLGNIYGLLEEDHEAVEEYEAAAAALEEQEKSPENALALARLYNDWAEHLRLTADQYIGDPAALAEQKYGDAIALLEPLAATDPNYAVELARVHNNRGILRRHHAKGEDGAKKDYEAAKKDYQKAIDVLQALPASGGSSWRVRAKEVEAWAHNNLGNLPSDVLGEGERREHYQSAIALLAELTAGSHRQREFKFELAKTSNNLALSLFDDDNLTAAEEENRRARELFEGLTAPLPRLQAELAKSYITWGTIGYGNGPEKATRRWLEGSRIYHPIRRSYEKDWKDALATLACWGEGEDRCAVLGLLEGEDRSWVKQLKCEDGKSGSEFIARCEQ